MNQHDYYAMNALDRAMYDAQQSQIKLHGSASSFEKQPFYGD